MFMGYGRYWIRFRLLGFVLALYNQGIAFDSLPQLLVYFVVINTDQVSL
jgi:hypothetical protein